MTVKHVSKASYVGGHAGVIAYHAILAISLIVSQYVKRIFFLKPRTFVIASGVILLIVALLSIWPIAKYDELEIN